jgi:hypothetical protein
MYNIRFNDFSIRTSKHTPSFGGLHGEFFKGKGAVWTLKPPRGPDGRRTPCTFFTYLMKIRRRSDVSIAKVWKIANKVFPSIDLMRIACRIKIFLSQCGLIPTKSY